MVATLLLVLRFTIVPRFLLFTVPLRVISLIQKIIFLTLKNHDLSWECFRKWLIDTKKYPSLRGKYSQAKQDGIEYSLSDAQSLISGAVEDSKHKEKTDLGSTHLIKEFISFI